MSSIVDLSGSSVKDEGKVSSYGTGGKKEAIARVWVKPGSGKITINKKSVASYFVRPVLQMIVKQPFDATNSNGSFDVFCTVKGGGLSGQASAIRHGISKALSLWDAPTYRPALKSLGLITRDARRVERKKYGRRKARRGFQFSKR